MFFYSKIIGTGSFLPNKVLTNNDLSKIVETNDEWITERTGIKERKIAAEDEKTSDFGYKAGLDAIKSAGLEASDIDCIILATTTPDNVFPATAVRIQNKLGIKNIPAFDMQAVCSGFVYALTVADSFIKTGMYKNVLVIGAETLSKIVNWEDRGTCILFGDGAGAVVLQAQEAVTKEEADKDGILSKTIKADGAQYEALKTYRTEENKSKQLIKMDGQEIYKHAIIKFPAICREALNQANLTIDDIDWFIPHQANQRIMDSVAKKLSLPLEKLISNIAGQGNTSAASIPLSLDIAVKNGTIKKDDKVLLSALGGGLTWGAIVIKY